MVEKSCMYPSSICLDHYQVSLSIHPDSCFDIMYSTANLVCLSSLWWFTLHIIQVKEKLKECLQLMHTALPYFPQAPPTSLAVVAKCSCQHCPASREEDREHSSSDYSQDSLLRSATQVALSYITVAHEQFNSFVCQASRQVG